MEKLRLQDKFLRKKKKIDSTRSSGAFWRKYPKGLSYSRFHSHIEKGEYNMVLNKKIKQETMQLNNGFH